MNDTEQNDISETITKSLKDVDHLMNEHITSAVTNFRGWVEESPEVAVQVALGAGFIFGATGLAGLTAVAGVVKWLANMQEWIPSSKGAESSRSNTPLKH